MLELWSISGEFRGYENKSKVADDYESDKIEQFANTRFHDFISYF